MEYTKEKWVFGWGNGLTGPTTPSANGPTCCKSQEYIPISKETETIAIVIRQVGESLDETNIRGKLISKCPEMYEALKFAYNILQSVETKYPTRDIPECQAKMAGIRTLINEIE